MFFSGPRAGQAEGFNSARVTIGKASNCDFQVEPAYEDVASQHAELILEEADKWMLYDLGTRSGTFVNGQKLKERQALLPEDYVRFGRSGPELIFRIGPPLPGYQPVPTLTAEDAQVQFFSGSDSGKTFTVSGSGVTRIGRRTELEIPLDPRGDMIISGNHCSIVFEDGAFIITDTSRNGTYVNGELVEGSTELNDGDVIMLGDGGPQSRFRAKTAGVIYPNLRAYYPAAHQAASPETIGDQPVLGTATPGQQEDLFASAAKSAPPRDNRLHNQDEPRNLGLWPIVAVMVLIAGTAAWWVTRPKSKLPAQAGAAPIIADYLPALRAATPKQNQVGLYTIALPDGWALRQQDALYSIESPDKDIAVDYARGLTVTEHKVMKLLSQDGLSAAKLPAVGRFANTDLTAYVAKGSGLARMAVLHQPKGEVPVLAVLETQDARLAKLPAELLESLLVKNVKTSHVALPATPTPALTPRAVATASPKAAATPIVVAQASPTAKSRALPRPTATPAPATPAVSPVTEPTRVTTPAAAVAPNVTPVLTQPVTTPLPTLTPEVVSAPAAAPQNATVVSQKLGLSIDLPENWNGAADEEEGIVNLSENDNLYVRIARDRKTVNLEPILASLTKEGWKRAGVRKLANFSMAELKKAGEDLILVLIPEPATGSTLVIYASREGDITTAQRNGIVQVVKQLRPVSVATPQVAE
ncbi:MAG: FHA domain-containing protein [Candidatus Sumerlaeaceae bacterium]